MPFGLEFSFPWLLVALPLLLLLPRARGWWLRLLALSLLLVALSGPSVGAPGGSLAVLVDSSQSVGTAGQAALAELPDDLLRETGLVYRFAGQPVPGLDEEPPPEMESAVTDLARALQVAAANGARRVLLVSDGAESRGNALEALPPVPVDTFYVPPLPNASLQSLLVPDRAAPGETIEAVAVVDSDRATVARLIVEPDGGDEVAIEQEIPAGRTPIPFSLVAHEGRELRLSARLEVDFEQSAGDDRRSAVVTVAEDEPVLVIGDPALSALLRSQQFDVVDGGPADIAAPLPYSAVVIRASAGQLTPGQLAELGSYVENGGGLMMTGGPDSFGFGGWYRTPVEAALPVDTDLRTEVDIPLVAMVIVLDRSQSMATGNPSKLELAKEGALGVVEMAYEEDLLGLVVFSDEYDWAFRLRPATERGRREMLASILGVGTGGGTILEPAYRSAITELETSEASLKHVIILSDGRLYDGRDPFGGGAPPDFPALAASAAMQGITTSAIAIGASADFETLEQIAVAGGGRYHSALDVATLPRIFTSEALTATRSLLREGPLQPVARTHPLSPFEGALPSVDAYIATAAKPTAEVIIEGVEGEPILAVRRHGLGRSAAFTSDLNGWLGDLASGPELATMLGSVVRWLQVTPAVYSASLTREANEVRVVVDAVEDGAYVNGAQLEARLDGRSVALEQVAPGRYEGLLPGDRDEGTVVVVEGAQVVARAQLRSSHPEFETAGGRELLAAISSRSGGERLDTLEDYRPELTGSSFPLWPYLAIGALLLFLIELLLRRFGRDTTPRRSAAQPPLGSSPVS